MIYKKIKYKDHIYDIGYTYTARKDLCGGIIEHELNLRAIDKERITEVKHNWSDSSFRRSSIIQETYNLIKKYIERQNKPEFSYINEFENWNGNLDEWDE